MSRKIKGPFKIVGVTENKMPVVGVAPSHIFTALALKANSVRVPAAKELAAWRSVEAKIPLSAEALPSVIPKAETPPPEKAAVLIIVKDLTTAKAGTVAIWIF